MVNKGPLFPPVYHSLQTKHNTFKGKCTQQNKTKKKQQLKIKVLWQLATDPSKDRDGVGEKIIENKLHSGVKLKTPSVKIRNGNMPIRDTELDKRIIA